VVVDPGRLDEVTGCEIIVIRPPSEESDNGEVGS
jgi:hypothetical protein